MIWISNKNSDSFVTFRQAVNNKST